MPYQMRGWCLAEIQWSSLRPGPEVGFGDGDPGVVGVVVVVVVSKVVSS